MFLLQSEFYSAAPGIPRSPNRTQGLVGIPRSKKKNFSKIFYENDLEMFGVMVGRYCSA